MDTTIPELPALLIRQLPDRRTVTAGVWAVHGSAHDPEPLAGATHLIEHLTLRCCGKHNRESLARLVDRLGGSVDAWTSVELMGVTIQTTSDALDDALGLLCDALLTPTFASTDVALEQRIAQAELDLVQDDPVEQAEEGLLQAAWGDHPLARPVIGSAATLKRLTSRTLRRHHKQLVAPGRLLAAVVGDVETSPVAEMLTRLPLQTSPSAPPLPALTFSGNRKTIVHHGIDQVHVRLAFEATSAADPAVPVLTVLNRILGVGASSRLFQKLREEAGLTYDIWSGLVLRSLGGLLEIGWACTPEAYEATHRLVIDELERFTDTISDAEIEIAKQAHTRGLQMDVETTAGLCVLEVSEVLERQRRFNLDQAIHEIDQVTVPQVKALAHQLFTLESMAMVVCGPENLCEKVS